MSSFVDGMNLSLEAANSLLRASLHDRVVGTLVGSALGDAIGLYTEFLSSAQSLQAYPSRKFTLVNHPPGGGPTPLKLDTHRAPHEPGDWTDDTDHALLLLLSFLHTASSSSSSSSSSTRVDTTSANPTTGSITCKSNNERQSPPLPDPKDLAARLRVWVQQGLRPLDTLPLGLGRLVGTVVATQGFAETPERVALEYWDKTTGRRAAPNGSLMRTHPLGLMCLFRSEAECFAIADELGRVTHADPRCVVSCVIGAGLVRAVVRGEVQTEADIDYLIQRGVQWLHLGTRGEPGLSPFDIHELTRHTDRQVIATLGDLKLDDPPAIGYVYKTLGSGILVLRSAVRAAGSVVDTDKMFEDLITELVMHGGDADTNACFVGALLGGLLGYKALPDHWKHGLSHREWFLGKAEALCVVLGLKDGGYDGQKDMDTHRDGGKPGVTQQEMEGRWMALQQHAFRKIGNAGGGEGKKSGQAEKERSGWTHALPWLSKSGKRG